MDNRTIDEVGRNEDRLIDKIELLEKENQEYKEVIDKIKKKYATLFHWHGVFVGLKLLMRLKKY